MNKHDAAVIKALADAGLSEEPELSPEQEELLARALDPEKEYLHKVKELFSHKEK